MRHIRALSSLRSLLRLAPVVGLLTACPPPPPDPSAPGANPPPGLPGEGTAGGPAGPPPEGAVGEPNTPPPPGEPDAGVPPTAGADAAGGPAIIVAEGNGTEVGGVIKWTGGKGTIRIDVLQSGGERDGAVLHAANFPQAGEWRVTVNKDQGEISLQAFVDYTGDGPGPDEPSILRKAITVRPEGNLDLHFDLDAAVADIGKAPRPQDGPPAPVPAAAPAAEGEAEAPAAEEGAEEEAPAKAKAKAKSGSKSKSKSSSKAKAKSEG